MERLTLLHSRTFPIERYEEALERDSIKPVAIASVDEIPVSGQTLNVLLLDRSLLHNGHPPPVLDRTAVISLGFVPLSGEVYLTLPDEPPLGVFVGSLRRAYQSVLQTVRTVELEKQLGERNEELKRINEIGIALATVRDHSVLLDMILSRSRELARADAGSLYLLDEIPDEGKVLRWKLAQNDSIDVDFEEKVLSITKKSLAGFVALTGEPLVIDDAYELPLDAEYSINRSFDLETGYRTKSMLVIPMTNHAGDLIGVLQLINRKRQGAPAKLFAHDVEENVIPFDEHTIELMRSLAGQAAVAVDNNRLYEAIERLFEGFVTAAVTAIEQRDPTTSGHSFRVADLTVEMAKTLDHTGDGEFRDVRFSQDQLREIRYASLLHDFGKVGVREQVLVKEKKLYPLHLETIRMRFEYAMKSLESDYTKQKLDYLIEHGEAEFAAFAERIDNELQAAIARLQRDLQIIVQSNEPTVLPEGDFQYLQQLAGREYEDYWRRKQILLSPEEAKILSIRKGNLDNRERLEIESHVTHTFEFLSKIPWTKDLIGIPDIAYAHHEKLNGGGYPRRLVAPQIPLQSRMMTVSDIYDALTASDRPYKRAITTDRALDILHMEVRDGLLDAALVQVFAEAKIWEKVRIRRDAP